MATISGNGDSDFIHRSGDGETPPLGFDNITGVTTGKDTIKGEGGDDILYGDAGNDRLSGGKDNDDLHGGSGNDTLDGGSGGGDEDVAIFDSGGGVTVDLGDGTATGQGNDTLIEIEDVYGSDSADELTGDNAKNALRGDDGDDVLKGLGGDDFLRGQDDDDILEGGDGDDDLQGSDGDDVLKGGKGVDTLDGGDGDDTADYTDKTTSVSMTLNGSSSAVVDVGGVLETIRNIENVIGGSGNDTLIGDKADNTLEGGGGDDLLKGGKGTDTLDGGSGVDTADYTDKTASVSVTLNGSNNAVVDVGGVLETIRNIENVIGGSGDDTLIGDKADNTLEGGGGNDLLKGGKGKDTLDGGSGIDTADYTDKTTSVSMTLNGSTNTVVDVGGVLETIRNIENVIGGSGNDTLIGDKADNALEGGGGNDLLKGGKGTDTLDGGSGVDTADYTDKTVSVSVTLNGSSNAVVDVGGVLETIRNIESVIGGSGNDSLTGDANNNLLNGLGGQDTLVGDDGSDVLLGGTEDDIIFGDEVDDSVNPGADRIDGGLGNDTLTGGAGGDTFVYRSPLEGLDTITDFNSESDTLEIDVDGFGGGLVAGGTAILQILPNLATAFNTEGEGYFILVSPPTAGPPLPATLHWDETGGTSEDAVALTNLVGVTSIAATDLVLV